MRFWRVILLGLSVVVSTAEPASAQIFLRLDGIKGSAKAGNHPGWMAILSVQCGLGRSLNVRNGGAQGTSLASFSEITCAKSLDAASPQLAFYAAGGGSNVVETGTLDFIDSNPHASRYLRVNLTNILISSYSQSTGGGVPTETFSLAPLVVSWNYVQYDGASGLPAGYAYDIWNYTNGSASFGSNRPPIVTTGIRLNEGVKLNWSAVSGHQYGIYAVSDLQRPFVLIATVTATVTGTDSYQFTPTAPAMFYTVQEIPAGY